MGGAAKKAAEFFQKVIKLVLEQLLWTFALQQLCRSGSDHQTCGRQRRQLLFVLLDLQLSAAVYDALGGEDFCQPFLLLLVQLGGKSGFP